MKKIAIILCTLLCLILLPAFVPGLGATAYARTYTGGTTVDVTALSVNDILESGVIITCPSGYALSIYVDGIHKGVNLPYTTTERYWVDDAVSNDNTKYILHVSIYFEDVSVSSVSLDKNNVILAVGDTVKLTATVLPESASDKTVTWSSSESSVASVNDGTVTALSKGKTIIYAKSNDGDKQASCNVTVLELYKEGKEANCTESGEVRCWIDDDDKVYTYDSSAGTYAIYTGDIVIPAFNHMQDNASMLEHKDGQAATCTVDGWEEYWECSLCHKKYSDDAAANEISAPVAITHTGHDFHDDDWVETVHPTYTSPGLESHSCHNAGCTETETRNVPSLTATTGITVDPTTLNLVTGKSALLTAVVTPRSASDKTVEWSSDDTGVATVDQNGNVTAVAAGRAVIKVTSKKNDVPDGISAYCTVNVTDTPVMSYFKVISGNKQTYKKKDIIISFAFAEDTENTYDYVADFKEARVKGDKFTERALKDGEFKAEPGSLKITLYKNFLKTLKPGKYTLTAELKSGSSAAATFTVPTSSGGSDDPKTGDDTKTGSLVLAAIMFILSLSAAAYSMAGMYSSAKLYASSVGTQYLSGNDGTVSDEEQDGAPSVEEEQKDEYSGGDGPVSEE